MRTEILTSVKFVSRFSADKMTKKFYTAHPEKKRRDTQK